MSRDDSPSHQWSWPPSDGTADREDGAASADGPTPPADAPAEETGPTEETESAETRVVGAASWGRRIGVLAAALSLIGLISFFIWTVRAKEPLQQQQAAQAAVNGAMLAGADDWAPDDLQETERRYAAALAEMRRQAARAPLLRNYAAARDSFTLVVSLAVNAAEIAELSRREARSAAERAIASAGESVLMLDQAEAIRITVDDRRLLRLAHLALREARIRSESGDYRGALSSAGAASRHAAEVAARLSSQTRRFVDRSQVGQWERWIEETVEWSRANSAPAILVNKEKNLVRLIDGGRVIREYSGDMGRNNLATKLQSGDEATPEGRYHVLQKRDVGHTRFYRALLLNYPNEADRSRFIEAKEAGLLPADAEPGGLIEIHGDGGRGEDWTLGCVALTNAEMDDLFARVRVGTPVTIVGGDGAGGIFSSLAERLESQGR